MMAEEALCLALHPSCWPPHLLHPASAGKGSKLGPPSPPCHVLTALGLCGERLQRPAQPHPALKVLSSVAREPPY